MDERGRYETCEEALAAWDKGEVVWTVEMGGLGPGYEQAIQILAMECLRKLLAVGFDWSAEGETDEQRSTRLHALLDPVAHEVDKWPGCGFSGAQVGAAMNLAANMHRRGYRAALDSVDEDRRTQVSRTWPHQPVEPR